jgi:transposase-like protein
VTAKSNQSVPPRWRREAERGLITEAQIARLAKPRGIRADKFPLHLKESEWRWNHCRDNLCSLLLTEIRSHPLN